MGRHDAYSYHSESGQISGEETPGDERESVREENKSWCEECGDEKVGVVERKGDLSGRKLCKECATELQTEMERKKALQDIRSIRQDRE